MRDLLELITERFEGKDRRVQTKQAEKLEGLLDDLGDDLRRVAMGYYGGAGRGLSPEKREAIAKRISSKSKAVLDFAVLEFEDKERGKRVKKKLRKWENFRKMLKQFADADGWDETAAVAKGMATGSKDAWEKFWEYKNFMVGAVRAFDVEHEGTVTVGPFSVQLFSSAGIEWDRDKTDKTKSSLTMVMRDVKSVGWSKGIGGKIHAYPSRFVPVSGSGGGGTLALYNRKLDMFRIAVGGDADRVARTMTHEFGHRVYYRVMGNRGRNSWEEFFGSRVGKPDLRQIMKLWEDFAAKTKHGAWLGNFYPHLSKVAPDQVMWLEMSADSIGLVEKFNSMTGQPNKGKKNVPGLEVFKAKMGEIKVFLHPVTTYSGTNASELFAETFAFIISKGPRRIPEITRVAFGRALPQVKGGSRVMEDMLVRLESLED